MMEAQRQEGSDPSQAGATLNRIGGNLSGEIMPLVATIVMGVECWEGEVLGRSIATPKEVVDKLGVTYSCADPGASVLSSSN